MKRFSTKDMIILLVALFIYVLALWFHKLASLPSMTISKQQSATNFDKDFLKIISIGNKRLISSSIWIKTLLDSDFEHYNKRDKNNWMYHRFRTIADLDPNFYENYLWGGMYLSIVKDDTEGAVEIYELGINIFKNDYKLIYNTGFTHFFERGDFEKGYYFLKQIENNPQTPLPVRFVIGKLRYQLNNNIEAAKTFLRYQIDNTKDVRVKEKLQQDLYALHADHDLKCLNTGKAKCSLKDIEGNPYVYKNKKWQAVKSYLPYRIFLKNGARQ